MIYFVCGASGSGKTACIADLKKQLPNYQIYDFDDIGVPENADKVWRQKATEKWVQKIVNQDEPTCLVGQMVLGEIVAVPSSKQLDRVHCCLLDCEDLVRIDRLKQRNTYGVCQDTLNWSSWLRMHFHDPQWEQRVIVNDGSSIMNFDRWKSLSSWSGVADVTVLDRSKMSILDVAKALKKLVDARL